MIDSKPPSNPAPVVKGSVRVTIAGESILLLAQRAAYWHAAKTLLIADAHLGKADSLRDMGAPLPAEAILASQLGQLDAALHATDAARILILGDLLHATNGLTAELVGRVAAWRRFRPHLGLVLVPGNHDRGLAAVADAWGLEVLPETHIEGPFAFTHVPRVVSGAYCWAGHIHPAVQLRSRADSLRLPCFHVGADVAVLPAFSRFTAGGPMHPSSGDRVFVIADQDVLEI